MNYFSFLNTCTRVSNELGAGNPKRAKGVVRVVVILKVAEAVIVKQNYTTNCSALYWIMNLLQVPITIGTTFYEVVLLYKGQSVIASKGDQQTRWHVQQLILYCMCGIISGIIGGLLGLGGGFILGPLFIGLGIHPQGRRRPITQRVSLL
ncbi:sulfite exporter TauE/SafE family protein 3-like isoform X2 [Glycine soja]|uniref:sulfite exporter TauE/SafE family protein 3-like isoform X2 n=1 Tax=Glycine soja TaxID=3848 RepID=UPI000E21B584|nr:sulfite exporter TauE/SafE family protein 3-like isoform X2 [Glycine soja]XP_040861628.1 sulfite exporter TauE/SafE family protein 3-like isoform X2 [Glycine max]|eukprot:XP_025979881.1 sulfite exporter TauE/SafE family protein 3-like isoform X2 [Glycine max]